MHWLGFPCNLSVKRTGGWVTSVFKFFIGRMKCLFWVWVFLFHSSFPGRLSFRAAVWIQGVLTLLSGSLLLWSMEGHFDTWGITVITRGGLVCAVFHLFIIVWKTEAKSEVHFPFKSFFKKMMKEQITQKIFLIVDNLQFASAANLVGRFTLIRFLKW